MAIIPQINLENITKSYTMGKEIHPVIKGINFCVNPHEFVSVMGPSGAGKSTLLNILGLLDEPTSGEYFIIGKNVTGLSSDQRANMRNHLIGFVFQRYFLLPDLLIWENVSLPLTYRPHQKSELEPRAREMLSKVGLEQYTNYLPNQLSGGQQQRVAIARALIGNPAIILADEPTGALDMQTGQLILDLFIKLNQSEKITIIMVTHNENISKQCQKTYHLVDGKFV